MNIGQLQQAGFNDQEIGAYVSSKTPDLLKAGFGQEEINDHFGIVDVAVPNEMGVSHKPTLEGQPSVLGKILKDIPKAVIGGTIGGLEHEMLNVPSQMVSWLPGGLSKFASLFMPEGKTKEFFEKNIPEAASYIPKTEWGKFFAAGGEVPFQLIEKYREPAASYVTEKTTPYVGPEIGAALGTAVGVSPELAMFAGPALAGKVRRAFIPKSEAIPMPGPQKALPAPIDVPLEAEIVPPKTPELTGPEVQKQLPQGPGFTVPEQPPETVVRKRPEPEAFIKTDQGYQPAFWNEELQEYVTPLRPSGQKALPPGQGFEMKPPTPKTILKKGPLPEKIPTGKGVQPKYAEGEPVPYTSEKGFLEIPRETKIEPLSQEIPIPRKGEIVTPPVTEVEKVGEVPLPTPTSEELALRKEKLKLVTKEEPTELDKKIAEQETKLQEIEGRGNEPSVRAAVISKEGDFYTGRDHLEAYKKMEANGATETDVRHEGWMVNGKFVRDSEMPRGEAHALMEKAKLEGMKPKPEPPPEVAKEPTPTPKAKEPWEMDWPEWVEFWNAKGDNPHSFAEKVGKPLGIKYQAGNPFQLGTKFGQQGSLPRDRWRRAIIEKALADKKVIPESVLDEYPDLRPTPPEKAPEKPVGLEVRKAEIGKPAEAPKVEEVWKMTPDQYQSIKGIHQPWIAEISPAQFAGLSKRQKGEYEAKRSKEWQASADVKAEWRNKVVAAHERGEFSLDDPNITKEAKDAIRSAIRIEEESRSKAALQQAHKENQIKSVDEIKEGDRVFDLMVRQYGIVKKKFKNSVKLELEKEIPIGLGRVSKDLTVNARELQWQSFDDLQESLKKPEPKPTEPAPPQPQPEAKAELPPAVELGIRKSKVYGEKGITDTFFQTPKAEMDAVDKWLVEQKHPLASKAGSQESRFKTIVKELSAEGTEKPPVVKPESQEIPKSLSFRKFVELKGVKWDSFNVSHPDYPSFRAAFDLAKSEKGAVQLPSVKDLQDAYERLLPRETRETVYQNAVNRFAAIENLEKRAQDLGELILPGELPGTRAREYIGIAQKVQSVLADKTYRINAEGKIEITGEGLKPVLNEFDKLSSPIEKNTKVRSQDFNDYFVARRTIEDLQRPKSPWTTEEIVTPDQVDAARDDLKRLRQKYGNDLKPFEQTAPRLYEYQKRVLQNLVDSGNISEERFNDILKVNPHYVPFDRILDTIEPEVGGGPKGKKPFTGARSPVKRIKGSEKEIHDIVGSIIKNTYRIMDVAERNTVARNVARLKDIPELDMKEVDAPIVPVGTIKMKGQIDAKLKGEILDFLKTLKGEYERKTKIGGQRLGYFQDPNKIVTRFASQESIDAHELGHFIDKLYGLGDQLARRGETAKELRTLADLRYEGQAPTPGFKKYVRKQGEKIAALIDSYITKPQLLEQTAPKSKEVLEKIIDANPELTPLKKLKPSLVYETEATEETVWGRSPFKPKGNVVEYYENGEKKYLQVPKNLYDAMTGLNEVSSDLFTRILSAPASWLRTGVTSIPDFIVRNFIRDQFDAFIQSKVGFRPVIDTVAALADVIKKSDVYYDWLRSGGAHSTFVDLSRKNLERMAKELRNDESALKYLNILNGAQEVSQAIEQATRLGIFKAGIRKGISPVEASLESREGTVDFGVRGQSRGLRTFSSITAFFNPGIQGTARFVRSHRIDPIGTALKAFALVTIPSIFLWALNKDDPDYKELPTWQKDLFWMIKVGDKDSPITWNRIPKPFLFGQVYGSAVERFLTYLDTKDPHATKDFIKTLIDASTPVQGDPNGVLLPTGIKPLIENATNWQFFREGPIVPESKQELLPYLQYGKYTTETAKIIGKELNWSPAKIENFIRGVTGGAGQYSLEAMDLAINQLQGTKKGQKGQRPREWADVPLVKAFVARPVESDPQSLRDFYDNAKNFNAAYKSYADSLKNIRSEDAKQILKDNPKMFLYPSIEKMRKNISIINKQIDLISQSNIPDEVKRQKIRQAERLRLKIAQAGNKIMEGTSNK